MSDNEKHSNPRGRKNGKSSYAMHADRMNPKPEYVDYVLRIFFDLSMADKIIIKHEDNSKHPLVVTDAYVPNTAVARVNATIKGTLYTFPRDFDFDYTFHSELNEVTGNGFDMIKETLYFKNLPGCPTLTGLVELKSLAASILPE